MTPLNTIIEEEVAMQMSHLKENFPVIFDYKKSEEIMGMNVVLVFKDWLERSFTTTAQRVREETIEECAVTVWNQWSKQSDGLEDTESSRAFARSVEAIRALSTLNK